MKINSICAANYPVRSKAQYKMQPNVKSEKSLNNSSQVAFKSTMGKLSGGVLGMCAAGFCALATATVAAPAALIVGTMLLSEAGGAIAGGYIGDKLTGDDDD